MGSARRTGPAAAGLLALASLAALACPAPQDGVEDRIRRFLGEMEASAEAREIGPLRRAVALDYGDPDGNDRDAVVGILTYHFLRNREIHLLTRIDSLDVHADGADVVVHVAMAGQEIPDAGALAGLRADLYRFDLALKEDGEGAFQLTRALWRPARGEDFF